VVRTQRNNWKTRKLTTPKRVRIRPKYSTTVASSWQEDKDETNKTNRQTVKNELTKYTVVRIYVYCKFHVINETSIDLVLAFRMPTY